MEALNNQTAATALAAKLITDNLDIWTSAIQTKSASGRGSSKKRDLYGIKKLRELILEMAVQGKLVPQDPNDEPASVLLERITAEREQLVKEKKVKKQKSLPEINAEDTSFSLPAGWEWVRLGDLCILENGDRSKNYPNKSVIVESGIPFVNAGHLQNSRINRDEMTFITPERFDLLRAGKFLNGDILYCLRGSLGKSALVEGFEQGAIASSLVIIRPYSGIDPNFLLRYFDTPLSYLMIKKYDNGTAQPNLSATDLAKFLVPLPSLSEQHRIVAKVDELMALYDQLEQQTEASIDAHATLVETLLATLTNSSDAAELEQNWIRIADHFDTLFTTEHSIDQLKQTVLQLAVMGKLVPQDPNDEPAGVLLEKIVAEKAQLVKEKKIRKQKPLPPIGEDEKPFALPEGWEWCRLQETVQMLGDGLHGTPHYDDQGDYYFVNGNNLRDGRIAIKPDTKRVSHEEYEKHRKPLGERSVLVSINGTLGNVAFYNNEPVMLGKSACYFNLWDQLNKQFYKRLIESPYFSDYAYRMATGSTIKNLGLKAMNAMLIALPPLAEQHRIVTKVDQLMNLCDQLKKRLQHAQQTQFHLADALVEKTLNR